jgi:hypothetical protein
MRMLTLNHQAHQVQQLLLHPQALMLLAGGGF